MRIRRASPLLILLASPSFISASSSPNDHSLAPANIRRREAEPDLVEVKGDILADATAEHAKATPSARTYKGTEDAPVDGQDGKPHAGPFVDTTPEESRTRQYYLPKPTIKARPTSLDRFGSGGEWKLEDIPERNDGVMNDENRQAPKKGTTGTEGGISEKEKERRLKGGAAAENKPQEPKEAPPLPHSEQEAIEEEEKTKQTATKDGEKGAKQKANGDFSGLEKPDDLPDRPHNLPHPDPKSRDEAPTGDRDSWLQDTMPYTEGNPKPAPKAPVPKTDFDASTSLASPDSDHETWHELFHSYVLSLTMILFSEIGDKTFLIAALMAMRHPRILVFSAAFGALIVMTVLSAVLGHAFPTILPKRLTTFAAAVLFLVFGARSLREGLAMDKNTGVGEEMKEVEAELEEKEHSLARRRSSAATTPSPYALEAGRGRHLSSIKPTEPSPPSSRSPSPSKSSPRSAEGLMNLLSLVLSPAWVQTFIMTFLGEWGDRSQIATIAMAAGQDYWWVTLGAITGHAFCTGLAVIGGRALAGRVSLRVVTIGGAVAFLAFGVIYLVECFTEVA